MTVHILKSLEVGPYNAIMHCGLENDDDLFWVFDTNYVLGNVIADCEECIEALGIILLADPDALMIKIHLQKWNIPE